MDILVVVDMQNDFIDMALGTKEAVAIVPQVVNKIKEYQQSGDKIVFTKDTHFENYMETQEGKNLPVPHCIRGTAGWEIDASLQKYVTGKCIDKPTFGSIELGVYLKELDEKEPIETITLIGLCTDICVISNAMIAKATLPEVKVVIDSACCAGVTPESHQNALEAMKMCQIVIE